MNKIKWYKKVALLLVATIIFQIMYPTISYALTSGPSQPEVQSFEPVGTSEMVDLFTGDFTYNIPLFELPGPNGGYPFNLSYNSGITMDQEASWVGLGWNLNPGVVNRQMRGLPDDFNGEQKIERQMDMKPNVTVGASVGGNMEIFGGDAMKGTFSLGMSIYYNNYKGMGYSLEPGLNFHGAIKDGMTAGLGFNMSLDSQEGVGINPSLSLINHGNETTNQFTFGTGINSRTGLTGVSMGFTATAKNQVQYDKQERKNVTRKDKDGNNRSGLRTIGGGSSLSFAGGSYSPQIGIPMQGTNLSVTVKTGGSLFGVFGNVYYGGFFNVQAIKNKKKSSPAYGYLYTHESENVDDALLDFSREKDGMIRSNTQYLATPSMNYDIYSVSGQGVGGMYRPYRSDLGILHDQQMSSFTAGGNGGFDAGLGHPHTGFDVGVNYSSTQSGKWTDNNNFSPLYGFSATNPDEELYEPFYFKSHGEHTSDVSSEMDYIGGTDPVRVHLLEDGAQASLVKNDNTPVTPRKFNDSYFGNSTGELDIREPRTTFIQTITNAQLAKVAGRNGLNEYKISYFNYPAASTNLQTMSPANYTQVAYNRGGWKPSAIAGITANNPDGSRYVYALPAYNTQQVECQLSVDDQGKVPAMRTSVPDYKKSKDKFKNRTSVPEYAHSYLLTSILGADYVDVDNIPGPSDGDFGYWVKFTYAKVNDYNWRIPFVGAHYSKGAFVNAEDDRISYTYGTKEIWHLAKAETKTHKAEFNISPRKDGRGAMSELQGINDANVDAYSYKLENIVLSVKGSDLPVQKVFFNYSNELCPQVDNNTDQAASGKLTLKGLYFTYGKNERGKQSPYKFDYNSANADENPSYSSHLYDRWGNYKPASKASGAGNTGPQTDPYYFYTLLCPYVDQFDATAHPTWKTNLDKSMAVWNLKTISLPSGGKIEVNYESDDYGYVQNEVAGQMFNVVNPDNPSSTETFFELNQNTREVYFDLETPIPALTSSSPSDEEKAILQNALNQYMPSSKQLYFKAYMKVKESSTSPEDYVEGYAFIDGDNISVDNKCLNGGNYVRAKVPLKKVKIGDNELAYHPFSLAAWQFIRTSQPKLVNSSGYDVDPNASKLKKIAKLLTLANFTGELLSIFTGYYAYANINNWGKSIHPARSFIRLSSPDKIKFGGGVRVKSVVLKDQWKSTVNVTGEEDGMYGQVYDYSIVEDDKKISSGVAAYEPMIGGEEISLRSAKMYGEQMPFASPNNLYTELPVNENLYPGPQVGYRKVTVQSLASAYANTTDAATYNLPNAKVHTTGAVEHEFYTAKDFPVIHHETTADVNTSKLWIPIPLIGQVTVNKITASQGYSIELNDMHGKPKKISQFKQKTSGTGLEEKAYSWVKYNYKCKPVPSRRSRSQDGFVLDNLVKTLTNDNNGTTTQEDRFLGQDYEFYTDIRESTTKSIVGGASVNTDIIVLGPIEIPAFVPWPNIGSSKDQVRVAVTNKIINRSGILISTEAFNEGELVKTENILFNAYTGEPVLTSVLNTFGDKIFSYNTPAHMIYEGMGPAFLNLGTVFSAVLKKATISGIHISGSYYVDNADVPIGLLFPGDELHIQGGQLTYLYEKDFKKYFYSKDAISVGTAATEFQIMRSGRRNQLSVSAGNVTARTNPIQ